ncbi:hypothetical protein [Lactococcus petauri]|uniref:hypothetical protein n=1 Tax=Lactococcus petauri TaxID=1940789 RepID=UPI001CD9140F|nr:hypothetical protein [Lactococcus petauri]
MADVVRFSAHTEAVGEARFFPFSNFVSRMAGDNEWWFTRTPAGSGQAWGIDNDMRGAPGAFKAGPRAQAGNNGGVRPALIIRIDPPQLLH